jgi:prepilin-type N-terminal cleavage/methylation domain-containing protein/prepilin-type processing-associated H-X9-DG protein
MSSLRRDGFTIVELLVVITIIGVLIAMLLPAVNAARESARQAVCINNQKELALAVIQYENAKGHYPGLVGQNGSNWVMAIMEYLGRSDLAKVSSGGGANAGPVQIGQLICPSDRPDRDGAAALSYIGNAAVFDGSMSSSDIPATTVMPMISERMFANPDAPPMWYDANAETGGFVTEASVRIGDRLTSQHSGYTVVAFCDGHVEAVDVELLFREDGTIWTSQ